MLYVTDYLGSVRAVVNGSNGAIYKASDFSTFGTEFEVASIQKLPAPLGTTFRDAYTGKEDQSLDFGTGYTDFGARQYSPALRRWMAPDPLSEKYYGISPYAFCNNNPVNIVDVDGRYFDKSNEKKAIRYERKLEQKAFRLDKQATRKEKRGKEVGDLKERSKELLQSSQDIRDMRSDTDAEYRFYISKDLETQYSSECNELGHTIVNISAPNFEGKIHEIRHGGQYARNELGEKYGVMDEVEAYRAQYSWKGIYRYFYDDTSESAVKGRLYAGLDPFIGTINDINLITPSFVNHLFENGKYIYPPERISPIVWNRN